MKALLIFLCFALSSGSIFANTNVRTWTLTDDSTLRAELIGYDEELDKVHLRINEKKDSYHKLADFTAIDQAWLVEWLEIGERLSAKLEEMPGAYTHYNWAGELGVYDFYVYEPSSVLRKTSRPMMILFSPGPNGQRYLLRHIDAAEETGMVIVTLDRFGNTHDSEDFQDKASKFLELFPQIEMTVAHNPTRLFVGGTSGGALQAFRKTANILRPWAGVYSNGGWLGTEEYMEEAFPPMRVVVVNGNNDRAANHYLKRDRKILEENGCTLAVIAFEGAHQLPPKESMAKAWDWLLDRDSVEEVHTD